MRLSFSTPISKRPVAYPAHFLRLENSNIRHSNVSCYGTQNRDHETQPRLSSRRLALLAPLISLGIATVVPKLALANDLPPPPPQPEISAGAAGASTSQAPRATPPSSSSSTPQQGGTDVPTELGTTSSNTSSSKVPKGSSELTEEAAKKLSQEEEERKKGRRGGKGRIRELQEIRAELAEKELVLLEKQQELLEKEQTVMVLREELEIERKLRALLTKEVKKAEEEAALAMGLCGVGGAMLP